MRPRLLGEYEQLIEDYKRDGWGIFDDSSDLHRAIAWSDVYYGDHSSVMAMFDAVGKPVVLQNVAVRESFGDRAFFWDFFAINNDFWFCAWGSNVLFKMNRETWELEYMNNFPSSTSYFYRTGTFYNGNGCLYFTPINFNELAEYNILENTMNSIYYECSKLNKDNKLDFLSAMNYGIYIFFSPCYAYNAIIRFNTDSKEIDFFDDWIEYLKQLAIDKKGAILSRPILSSENTFMFTIIGTNVVVEFNMNTLKSHIYDIGQKDYQYNDICFDGENFWLSPYRNGPIVKWNPDIGIIKEFANPAEESIHENDFRFGRIIFCEGYVWLFPSYSKQTFKINIKMGEVLKVEEFKPDFTKNESRLYPAAYGAVQNIGNVIYAFDLKDGTFIEYDCKTQKKREKIIKYSQSMMEKIKSMKEKHFLFKDMAKCQKAADCYYYEQPLFAISDYINCDIRACNSSQKQLKIFGATNSNADGRAGKEIFRLLHYDG
jgi:hypothetical protein